MIPIFSNAVHLYIDGLREGDPDLQHPCHYLASSGGYDYPQGESSRSTSIVVLEGWTKASLETALVAMKGLHFLTADRSTTIPPKDRNQASTQDDSESIDIIGEEAEKQVLDGVYYHTGGRIRDALEYVKDPTAWKSEKASMIQ